MKHRPPPILLAVAALALASGPARADTGKLLLTGGVSTVAGSAGGGLTPWAVIGSNATEGEMGVSAHATRAAIAAAGATHATRAAIAAGAGPAGASRIRRRRVIRASGRRENGGHACQNERNPPAPPPKLIHDSLQEKQAS